MNAEQFRAMPVEKRRAALARLTVREKERLYYHWPFMARGKQLPPVEWGEGGCYLWIIRAGRGWGKTLTGAKTFIGKIQREGYQHTALCGATAGEVRDIMIKGPSGILASCPPWFMPEYRPSEKKLVWPNEAVTSLFYGSEPELSRGWNGDLVWIDELHKFAYPRETIDNLLLGLRMGHSPLALITSTPKPTRLCRELETRMNADGSPAACVTVGNTLENRDNLPPVFLDAITSRYQGSRLGLQELEAEILDDNPNALFKREQLDAAIVEAPPSADKVRRIVVAVDPAASAHVETSNHNGIIALYEGAAPEAVRAGPVQFPDKKHYYVVEDASLVGTPEKWGYAARVMVEKHRAGTCLYESNQGGDMVRHVLETAGVRCVIRAVHAAADKEKRALNPSLIAAQGRLHLVRGRDDPGALGDLEDELTTWVPGEDSPDRMDALVHAVNYCEGTAGGVVVMSEELREQMRERRRRDGSRW